MTIVLDIKKPALLLAGFFMFVVYKLLTANFFQ